MEPGFLNLNPTLLSLAGTITLSWAYGDYIALCGGCITDYRMQLVQLDPVDLAPVSNIVELTGPSGLISAPIIAASDTDIAYLVRIDYHAQFELGAAMVRCAQL